ncbi:hypothetical protein F2P56_037196 [Juglans regia]|uniref:Transposase-associated domain-containing protein n=2 Tax=Juglans regia TaxID=51240 RepID=A0A833WSD2_JUGRE|nr:uncharacterized protein LOC108993672 [Juglans regia]KAF5441866.1 hypothetical protein F2P56_037196 [Juglans regia]
MDKTSWMTMCQNTKEYVDGVNEFLKFASDNMGIDGLICCPCKKCCLSKYFKVDMVHDHLIYYGICQGYTIWHAHGEKVNFTPNVGTNTPVNDEQSQEGPSEMHTMLQDVLPMFVLGVVGGGLEMGVEAEVIDGNSQVSNEGVQKFYNMLKDADEPLYEGCTKHSRFSAIVRLWNMKCLDGWSNNIFAELLEFLNELLPSGASLPKTTYEAKKLMSDLELECVKIPVCPNGCMLFWKNNENRETCIFCQTSKWKQNADTNGRNKRSLAKVLRWFPLKSRLQRLFMSSKIASHMKWHAEGRIDDGVLRHPADGMAWKTFDSQHNDFVSDPRNVRLGLAADGFNNMSISHSTWPIMIIPYNLPPWMCMKRSTFMLSLIILGPSSTSIKIDVYLEPSITELKELWEVGSPTYNAYSKRMFTMRAALMWTINDFLAYGDLSGRSTKGRFACICCMDNTWSKWLKHEKKFSYMGHRRFLPMDHRWRKQASAFDGTKEINHPPIVPNGDDILRQLENVEYVADMKKRKRTSEHDLDVQSIWKKCSIFFGLPILERKFVTTQS